MYRFLFIFLLTVLFGQVGPSSQQLIQTLLNSGISIQEARRIASSAGIDPTDFLEDSEDVMPIQNLEVINDEQIRQEVKQIIDSDENINADLENGKIDDSNLEILNSDNDNDSDSKLLEDKLLDSETIKKVKKFKSDEVKEFIDTADDKKLYFGYDIFNGNPEVFQKSNFESIDQGYIIGPGDEVLVLLWGETELNEKFIVSRDGYIFIPNIGQVFVNGLTLEKLEKKLFSLLKKVYSSLGSNVQNNKSYLDISLGSLVLRPIRIFALGDVEQPGSYSLKPSSTLFTSLFYFNGPSLKGSLRNIDLIRNSKKVASIDFYDYLLTGKKNKDFRLQRDDVIFVNPRSKTVRIAGAINREKYFELKDDNGLKYLLDIAGGLKANAYTERAQINRIIPFAKRDDQSKAKTIIDVELEPIISGLGDFHLEDGDEITIFSINDDLKNVVEISGGVNRPGNYYLSPDLTLSDLITKAGNLVGDAYLERVDISRKNDDLSKSLIKVNLAEALKNNYSHNIKLMSDDFVTVYRLSDLEFTNTVSIQGHVFNPGEYEFQKGMDVSDLIFKGGGFRNKDHLAKTHFARAELYRLDDNMIDKKMIVFSLDSVLAGESIAGLKLNMGDEIRIYSTNEVEGLLSNTVKISGYVKRPGDYTLFENLDIKNLLFLGGGLEDPEHSKNVYYKRADLVRYNKDLKTKSIIRINLNDILNKSESQQVSLVDGDELRVYSKQMFELSNNIQIKGIVKSPGTYELKTNMTLKDLILEAGGVTKDIRRYRCEISTLNPKGSLVGDDVFIKTVDLDNNLNSFFDSNTLSEYFLKPFDIVHVRANPYFVEQKSVKIDGGVFYPGEYVLSSKYTKVSEIIERAGGLTPESYPAASKFVRDSIEVGLSFEKIIKNPRSKFNFVLNANDSIYIGEKLNMVQIEGEVNNPGYFQYIKNYSFEDYVKIAGGRTRNASKYGHYVVYPDGTSKSTNLLIRNVKVLDGSRLVILPEEDIEEFNITEYVTNLTQIYSDLMQAYVLIALTRNN